MASFLLIYFRYLTIDVSFLCVSPLNEGKLRHSIVKIYHETTRLLLAVPQPL